MAEAALVEEVARLRNRLAEEEAWQTKILAQLERKREVEDRAAAAAREADRDRADALEAVRRLEDEAVDLRDIAADANERAAAAEARARALEAQRARNLEGLAGSVAETGLLKREVEALRAETRAAAAAAAAAAPRAEAVVVAEDVDAVAKTGNRHLEFFLDDLGLDGDHAPRLRALGAKRIADLVFLHDSDLDDLGMAAAEKRVLKRVFARIRALIDLVCDDHHGGDDDPAAAIGCSLVSPSASPRAARETAGDCALM